MATIASSWLVPIGKWLERHDGPTALLLALAALMAYAATLAPGLTIAHDGADGGDLISAAWTSGVPHPTGYPTYVLLARLFTRLPLGNVAYRVNLLSAVSAAAVVGLLYRVVRLTQRDDTLPPEPTHSGKALLLSTHPHRTLERWGIAVAAAMSLATSSLLWSQAVIAEVYALHALFASLLLWCCAEWQVSSRDGWLWAAGLCLGLGLGNHLTLAVVAVAGVVWLLPQWRGWLRLHTLAPAAGLCLLGLTVYTYLPLAARGDPPVNWGDPQTWRSFWWLVSGAQYRPFVFGLEASYIPGRLYQWADVLGDQFGWCGLVLVLAGLGWLWKRRRPLAVAILVLSALLAVYAFGYQPGDSYVYLLPAFLGMTLWWAEGGAYLLALVDRDWRWLAAPRSRRLALLGLALLPLVSLSLHWGQVDLGHDWSAQMYIHVVLDERSVEPGSLLVTRRDAPTFILWYGQFVEGRRPALPIVNGPLLAFPWYRDQIRERYPELPLAPESETPETPIRDLIQRSLPLRPVYATDPPDEWRDWFDFEPVDLAGLDLESLELIWRVNPKTSGIQ
jgi:hypothetical protein